MVLDPGVCGGSTFISTSPSATGIKGQRWLDGVASADGKVMQFVAVPTGDEYSVEAQITGSEVVGGIQITITPIKAGKNIKVIVKQIHGPRLEFDLNTNSQVNDLFEAIKGRLGIPVSQFKLLYHYRVISQSMSLLS
jgi:hypothetical protein